MKIKAPANRDVTVSVGKNPDNNSQEKYPEGFSAVLENGSVVVKAGTVVTAPLYISLGENAIKNDHSPTLITLEVQNGARVGHWCLLLNSEEPHVPEY